MDDGPSFAGLAVDQALPLFPGTQQGQDRSTTTSTSLEPCNMTWWSLTRNIAREWRLMMQEVRLRTTR